MDVTFFLKNGKRVTEPVVRYNQTSIWVDLPDGNTIKRSLKRLVPSSRVEVEEALEAQRKRNEL